MTAPELEFVCELNATLAAAIEIGHTPAGLRRIVTLIEGTFEGPLLRGTILPGGVDWQIIRADGVAELDAHYVLKTADGVLIRVQNGGLRHGPAEVLKRIADGGNVDPSEYYFRTTPVFEAPAGPYEWLNRSIFTATAHRKASSVIVAIFRVR
jgi:hypothetical protein